jgi:hypothetical protein
MEKIKIKIERTKEIDRTEKELTEIDKSEAIKAQSQWSSRNV